MSEKTNMFIVIKREDVIKYLTYSERQNLDDILDKITNGRKQDNKNPINYYYVCNTDEPYANAVHDVIIGGEIVKANNLNPNQDACGSNGGHFNIGNRLNVEPIDVDREVEKYGKTLDFMKDVGI